MSKGNIQPGRITPIILAIIFTVVVVFINTGTAFGAAVIELTPLTWNVVGLQSNDVLAGPEHFPVGVRACNTGDEDATNVEATFVWDSANTYIDLRSGSLSSLSIDSLAPGACQDLYFEVTITRDAAAFDTARGFHIQVTADGGISVSTPTPREIYVVGLVAQNRNGVDGILLDGVSIPVGGSMDLVVGYTYEITLVAHTATQGYRQIESFINFPNTIFLINDVVATYTRNDGTDPLALEKMYADGCTWQNDPSLPNYLSCLGVGNYGGSITITYNVTIIGGSGTNQTLNSLIYDMSGGSYHMNGDYSTTARVGSITDPGIAVTKTPDVNPVASGGTVNFSIEVSNTDHAPIGSVVVTDAECDAAPVYLSGDTDSDSELDPTEIWSYTCSKTNVTTGFSNQVDVNGVDTINSIPVTDSDTVDITVFNPVISVSKSPDVNPVAYNGTVTFTIEVSNPGDVPLENIVVTDAQCDAAPVYQSGDTDSDSELDLSETWVYSCSTANVTAPFSNTVDAQGDDIINGGTVTDSDTVDITISTNPVISVTKTPDSNPVAYNGTVTFTIEVSNPGDVPLENIVVTDAQCDAAPVYQSGDTDSDSELDLSETWVYSCSTANVTAPFSNTVDAQGDDTVNGGTVTDSDTVDITISTNPVISVTKTPDSNPVAYNGTVTFTIEVTNPGDVPLENIVVADAQCDAAPVYQSGDTDSDSELDPTEIWSYTCSKTNVTTGFSNQVDVNGVDTINGGTVTDSDTVDITISTNPVISVTKTPDSNPVAYNGTVTFTIEVSNPGDVPLENIVVTDLACDAAPVYQSGDTDSDSELDLSETWAYSCSTANVTAPFSNVVDADGDDTVNGGTVTDSDTVDITISTSPAILVTKTPDSNPVAYNGTVTFTIEVSNPGDVPLENIVVADLACDAAPVYQSGDTDSDSELDLSETWAYSCSTANVTAPFINTVDAQGDDTINGGTVSDSDTVDITIATATIGDLIWDDVDGDGVQDAGENGIPAVTVFLYDSTGGLVDTQITDGNGNYQFSDIFPGDYTVVVDVATLPAGYTQTGDPDEPGVTCTVCDSSFDVTVNSWDVISTVDFGYNNPGSASLGDYIWDDANGDGVQDIGESGIPNIHLYIDLNGNDIFDAGEPEDTTDANGYYTISNLTPGTYTVRVDSSTLPPGYTQTGDPDQPGTTCTVCDLEQTLTVNAGDSITTVDFGFQDITGTGTGVIGDTVWEDANNNSVQDAGETGIAGVTINLTEAGPDGLFGSADDIPFPPAITDGNGNYSFNNLPAGSYLVDVDESTLPAGAMLTTSNEPLIVALADGQSYLEADFGYIFSNIAVSKELIATNLPNSTGENVAIGEIATYRLTIDFAPVPGLYPAVEIHDLLDLGLAFMYDPAGAIPPCTISADADLTTSIPGGFASICNPATFSTYVSIAAGPDAAAGEANNGRDITFNLGDVENTSGAAFQTLTIEYNVVVLDNEDNNDGDALNNEAYYDPALVVSAPDVNIVEPDMNLSKSVSPTSVQPGDVVTYSIEIFHTPGSNIEAFDVMMIDPIPAGLNYVAGSAVFVSGHAPDSLTGTPAEVNAVWNVFPNDGTNSVIQFQATVDASLGAGDTVINIANLQWTSMPGDVTLPQSDYNQLSTERFYDPGDPVNVYGSTSSVTIVILGSGGAPGDGSAAGLPLPATGFVPGTVTSLPPQPEELAYIEHEGLWLEIPTLKIEQPIVGIQQTRDGWDTTWLWQQLGYLQGTAFPTWKGNTAITGHVYLPSGLPGPFLNLKSLAWGDQIIIHFGGQQYIYEVRLVKQVLPSDSTVLGHKSDDWLTLITCSGYDAITGKYSWRTAVQAVLIKIQ